MPNSGIPFANRLGEDADEPPTDEWEEALCGIVEDFTQIQLMVRGTTDAVVNFAPCYSALRTPRARAGGSLSWRDGWLGPSVKPYATESRC